MWFSLKSYFWFLCQSSNQHGVHSPFVYQLVTRCFYQNKIKYPQWTNQKKVLRLKDKQFLWRFFQYTQPSKIIDLTANNDLNNLCSKERTIITDKNIYYFGNNIQMAFSSLNAKNILIKNDDIWVLYKPHQDKTSARVWKSLQSNSLITLTIDVYWFGLIFFRKEQPKQDFKIRL